MGGYAGQILFVDLSSGRIQKRPLDPGFARNWLGGLGFGTRLYLDGIADNPEVDALSAENPFVLMTGPLTGLKLNAVARWTVGSRSPLTGFWGEANIGGYFGAELKFAGFDGLVISGAASRPTYLHIEDGQVSLKDATPYWGLDVYEATDRISADLRGHAHRPGQICAIGPAGERGVRFASILNAKAHAAGRSGMGAVWGAKKLKAVFVRGHGSLEVARPDRFEALRLELKKEYAENVIIGALKAFGTMSHIDVGQWLGDIPLKNWSAGTWQQSEDLSPLAYNEKLLVRNHTCYGCSVACKRRVEVKQGPFRTPAGAGPEYETVASFGHMCLNSDLQSIAKANEICNRYGMDTITCGTTIAFAIECFEAGLLNSRDVDDLELNWGNASAIVRLAERIGRREGFGALLAEGSRRAAQQIGSAAEALLTTVKGLEAPMHDPRGVHGYGLAYAVAPRGACHTQSINYPLEGGGMHIPEIAEFSQEIVEMSSRGKAALTAACQDFGTFFASCAVFCTLGGMILNATQVREVINSVTGFDYSLDELLRLGRKVWYAKRGLSNLFGARAEDDRLPLRLLTPLPDGAAAGSVPDMELMLKEFYQLRSLTPQGLPQPEVLEALDLGDLARLLYTPNL